MSLFDPCWEEVRGESVHREMGRLERVAPWPGRGISLSGRGDTSCIVTGGRGEKGMIVHAE